MRWISRFRGWLATTSERKATNSALVCRGAVFPITSPDRVFNAANKRKSPVPVVLKAVTFGASRRQREHRFASVERLNSCFFINTKDRCMLGRIHVEADHIRGLLFEIGVVRHHVAFESMRLKSSSLPNSRHHHVIHTEVFRELSGGPMARAVRWLSSCPIKNSSLQFRRSFLGSLASMSRVQSRQAVFFEALLPSTDVAPIATEGFRERRIRFSLRQTKYEPRSPNVFRWQGSRPRTPSEFAAFMGRKNESSLGEHA